MEITITDAVKGGPVVALHLGSGVRHFVRATYEGGPEIRLTHEIPAGLDADLIAQLRADGYDVIAPAADAADEPVPPRRRTAAQEPANATPAQATPATQTTDGGAA